MEKATGYSLWLMPSGNVFDQLSAIIRSLSKAHRTLVFEPHVTLLGGLHEKESGIIARTKKLAEVLQPLTITLNRIEYGAEYFQCLYYRVEKTTQVRNAYARACGIFRISQEHYVPHLSLMYGDIPHAVKEKTAAKPRPHANTFTAEYVDLVLTDGTVEDWRKVQRFAL